MRRYPRHRVEFFLALGGLAAIGPLSMDMFFPALPAIGRDLDVAPSAVMLTVTAYFIGLTIGQGVGPVSDIVGRRRPLLIGVILFMAASLACATAQSVEVLAAARFVQGLTAAVGVVLSRAIVRDLYSGTDVARHYSTLIFMVGLTAVVSPTIATSILGLTSWRGIFVTLFVIGAVLLLVVALRLPESLPRERRVVGSVRATRQTYGVLVLDRRFLGYGLTLACVTGAFVTLVTGSTFVVQDEFGVSAQGFAFMFSVAALAVVVATVVNRRLLRRFSSRRLLLAGLVANAAGALGLLLVGRLGMLPYAACFVLVLAMWGFIAANATAIALSDYASMAGAALALLGLMQYTAGALAAPLAGAVGNSSAVSVGIVVSCFCLVGLATAALTVRSAKRAAVSPASCTAGRQGRASARASR